MSSPTSLPSAATKPRAAPRPGAAAKLPSSGLSVGYLVVREGRAADDDTAILERAGCGAIRRESSADGDVLTRLLAFLSPDDLLVLPSVHALPDAYGGLGRLLDELEDHGVTAVFLAEALRTDGEEGRLLRRAVLATAELRTPQPRRRPSAAIHAEALAMHAAGAGPSAIARALRISRMTVWRWLKTPA
jgi:DNA invertase Pin-like site-specific DNA recombinase